MILIVDDHNRDHHADELDAAFRLRHEVLVEGEGWEALRRADGREIDAFDGPGSIHFLLYWQDKLTGYQRLLPTTGPHLLSDVYPHLCDGPLPRSSSLFEWTRIAVRPDGKSRGQVGPAALQLVLAMVEWCQDRDMGSVILETEPYRILSLAQLHFRVAPLGIIQPIDGVESIALDAHFDHRTVTRIKSLLGPEMTGRRAA